MGDDLIGEPAVVCCLGRVGVWSKHGIEPFRDVGIGGHRAARSEDVEDFALPSPQPGRVELVAEGTKLWDTTLSRVPNAGKAPETGVETVPRRFCFCRSRPRPGQWVTPPSTATLLDYVRKLVGNERAVTMGGVPGLSRQQDVLANRGGAGRGSSSLELRKNVGPHSTEVVTESRLHEHARAGIEWSAGLAQDILNGLWRFAGNGTVNWRP